MLLLLTTTSETSVSRVLPNALWPRRRVTPKFWLSHGLGAIVVIWLLHGLGAVVVIPIWLSHGLGAVVVIVREVSSSNRNKICVSLASNRNESWPWGWRRRRRVEPVPVFVREIDVRDWNRHRMSI